MAPNQYRVSAYSGKKSTALEVINAYGTGKYLAGKTAIVTGGNSGIGLETVKALAHAGARVLLCSRSVENGKQMIDSEIKVSGLGGYIVEDTSSILVKQLDLADLKSVKALADDINASEARIDFLVLNAGIMALPNLEYTAYGFEKQIGTNHFGHFYFTQLLLEKMKKQGFPSRVVVLSSSAHQMGSRDLKDLNYKNGRGYGAWGAYGQSKLANLLFAKGLQDRVKDTKITAVSLHPGVISTNLFRQLGTITGWLFSNLFTDKTIPQGASTTLYACLAPELAEPANQGSYLDNCAIATPNSNGVDKDSTLRNELWDESVKLLDEALAAHK